MQRITGNLDDGRVVFGAKPTTAEKPAAAETKAKDPVCGMLVDPTAATTAFYDGHTYFFCSADCRKAFEADPNRYLGQR